MNTCLYLSRKKISRKAMMLALWLALLTLGEPPALVYAQQPTPTPVPPAEIPEPITVILFGTGLAALSALSAYRKSKQE